jgi:hypothetical protein
MTMTVPHDDPTHLKKYLPLPTPSNVIEFVPRQRLIDQAKIEEIERYLRMASHDRSLSLEVRTRAVIAATYFGRRRASR